MNSSAKLSHLLRQGSNLEGNSESLSRKEIGYHEIIMATSGPATPRRGYAVPRPDTQFLNTIHTEIEQRNQRLPRSSAIQITTMAETSEFSH
jgi:hypothetical protein